jgi:tetratricopeptide (TPR) repeat protein
MNLRALHIFILLFFSGIFYPLFSQALQPDSLDKLADDSVKVDLYYKSALQTPQENTLERVKRYNLAISLSKKINYRNGIVKYYRALINYLFNANMYALASDYGKEFILYCERTGMKNDRTEMYIMLSNLFAQQGNYEEALKYLRLKGGVDLDKEDYKDYGSVLFQIGQLHYNNGIYDSALVNTLWATEIFKHNNMSAEIAAALLNSARIYMAKGFLNKAEEKAGEASEIYAANGNTSGLMHALVVSASIYSKTNRIDSAMQAYHKALIYADSLHSVTLKKECYKNLSELYGNQKKYKESYEYQLLFRKYYDTAEAEMQKAKLKEFELRYELARSGKTIVKRESIYEGRQKKFILVLLAIIALLTFLLIREKMNGKGPGTDNFSY